MPYSISVRVHSDVGSKALDHCSIYNDRHSTTSILIGCEVERGHHLLAYTLHIIGAKL